MAASKTCRPTSATRLGDPSEVRDIYLHPAVTDEYSMQFGQPDVDGVIRFLCDERLFSRERVAAALERAFPNGGGAETAARLPF
jgi:hypothetical protein